MLAVLGILNGLLYLPEDEPLRRKAQAGPAGGDELLSPDQFGGDE